MLILHPTRVSFAAEPWEDVTAISIDRSAQREIIEWGELGPHAVFADVPEQLVIIKVAMELTRTMSGAPAPGDQGTLIFETGPTTSDGSRRTISALAVVRAATHQLSRQKGAVRSVELIAISLTGAADPILIS